MIVADAGYKTPAIARQLLKDRIEPLFPYKRPMTKKGFFKKVTGQWKGNGTDTAV